MTIPRLAAALFALFGTLAVLLLAIDMPPYQNPDEPAHFARADEISHLQLISRGGPAAPKTVDQGIDQGNARFSDLPHHPERHATRDRYAPVPWGDRAAMSHDNTAMYPPFFYVPAAIAIKIGKQAGLSVLPTLELARAAGGLVSVAIGTAAIALADAAALWLFAVLSLPMALGEMAALSQDGPMIALSALAVALVVRIRHATGGAQRALLSLLCLVTALVGMARPPYAPFALLLILAPDVPLRRRAALLALSLALVTGWCLIIATVTGLYAGFTGADAGAQLRGLLHAPWRVFPLMAETLSVFSVIYRITFIGMLGWMDVELPTAYRWAAYAMLGVAVTGCVAAGRGVAPARCVVVALAAAMAATLAIFAAQYLTWTPVGAARIEGVQGRYFLPVGLIAGAALAGGAAREPAIARMLAWPVLLFPVATIVITLHRVVLRYYF
jgi:uncharacterized membrane protein